MTKETGAKVKEKLDEIGVTQVAKDTASKVALGGMFVGGFIMGKAKLAKDKLNEKIDEHENIAHARDVTKEKVGIVTGFVS